MRGFYEKIGEFVKWMRGRMGEFHVEHSLVYSGRILTRELDEIIEEAKKRMTMNDNLNDSK